MTLRATRKRETIDLLVARAYHVTGMFAYLTSGSTTMTADYNPNGTIVFTLSNITTHYKLTGKLNNPTKHICCLTCNGGIIYIDVNTPLGWELLS